MVISLLADTERGGRRKHLLMVLSGDLAPPVDRPERLAGIGNLVVFLDVLACSGKSAGHSTFEPGNLTDRQRNLSFAGGYIILSALKPCSRLSVIQKLLPTVLHVRSGKMSASRPSFLIFA